MTSNKPKTFAEAVEPLTKIVMNEAIRVAHEPVPFYQLYSDEPDWWAADAWTFGYTAAMGLCFTFNWSWGKIQWAK